MTIHFQILILFSFLLHLREALQEDEEGSLQATVDDIIQRAKRRRLEDRPSNVRLGMVRSEVIQQVVL